MKSAICGMALLATLAVLLGCGGGGSSSLQVQPASGTAFTDYANQTYQGLVLTATLDGKKPTGLTWKTSQGCVAVDNFLENTATVICNFTCGIGTIKATITATAQGMTGRSSVTCTWR